MLWACFCRDGVARLSNMVSLMDKIIYRNIVGDQMLPHAIATMLGGWLFQQDSDLKHTSGVVEVWFRNRKVRFHEWFV